MQKIAQWMGSMMFFRLTLLLFALESGWLALTSRFPMAYDEAYHLDLIRFFSHHLNPVITSQTTDTYKLGALIQDPSFLYHWLMSFPYRVLAFMTDSVVLQVAGLRLINVALVVASLVVLRRLLKLLGASDALGNVVVLLVAFTPLVVVLSAQISYDNLLILAVSGCMYLAVSFLQQLRRGAFATGTLGWLVCVGLFSSLIKFAFLPVLVALTAVVLWSIAVRGSLVKARKGLDGLGNGSKLLLAGMLVAGSLLFIRYYGVNMVRYHDPAPRCDRVLNIEACEHYYAWYRGYVWQSYKNKYGNIANLGPVQYTSWWATVNTFELFGAIIPLESTLHVSLPLFIIAAIIGTIACIVTAIHPKRFMRKYPQLTPLVSVVVVYVFVLWARNYHDGLRMGLPISIHGRYLVPVLAYAYIVLAFGVRDAFNRQRRASDMKAVLALAVILAFVCFGGFMQQILHVAPEYGHLNMHNDFNLKDASHE